MAKSKTELGDRIRQAIRRTDLTYEQIGERLGVTKQAVQKWAGGSSTPTLHNLEKLARVLQVNIQWLVTGNTSNVTIPLELQKELSQYPRNSVERADLIVSAVLMAFGMGGFHFYPEAFEDYREGNLSDATFYQAVYSEIEVRVQELRKHLL